MSWTYFAESIERESIKIGFSAGSPIHRIRKLQTGSAERLRLVGLLEGDREREMHQAFHDSRLSGEWFSPSEKLVDFIYEHAADAAEGLLLALARIRASTSRWLDPNGKPIFDYMFSNDRELMQNLHLVNGGEFKRCKSTETYGDPGIHDMCCRWHAVRFLCDQLSESTVFREIGISRQHGRMALIATSSSIGKKCSDRIVSASGSVPFEVVAVYNSTVTDLGGIDRKSQYDMRDEDGTEMQTRFPLDALLTSFRSLRQRNRADESAKQSELSPSERRGRALKKAASESRRK